MLVTVPHTLRQVLSTRGAPRPDGPGRLVALCALVGAGMIAVAVVLAVEGSSSALPVGLAGALVQVGGFLGALWWTVRHPEPPCNRGRS